MQQRPAVVAWAGSHPTATIFTPNAMGIAGEITDGISSVPKFAFGSLMGLQRGLAVLRSRFRCGTIETAGFDFSLSPAPYRPWYPSLIPQQYDSFADAFVDTNMRHDFLLNYMYVRVAASRGLVAGSVTEFTDIAVGDVMHLFETRLRGRRVGAR
jgi:hypothetical protein